MKTRQKAGAALLAAVATTTLGVMNASPAAADTYVQTKNAGGYITNWGCGGWVVHHGAVRNPMGTQRGTWYLYYSNANGGTNCLKVVNTTGRAQDMEAAIAISGSNPVVRADDWGFYRSYAGGVNVPRAAGRCVNIDGHIADASFNLDDYACR